MMTKTPKVITIETHQQIWIRGWQRPIVAWCESCGQEILMLVPEQAATLRGVSERRIFQQIENGELHFIETGKGKLFVCSNSVQ